MMEKYAVGIDLGGTNMRAGLVSGEGKIIEKMKEPTSETLLDSILRIIEGVYTKEIAGIGLGVAGLVNTIDGKIPVSPNLHPVEKINFIHAIREKFGVPVYIENDANAAALGELWAGAGRQFSSFVLFTLGTGIGGGIVHNRELLDVPAEIGHMSINAENEKCQCGNSGCLETYSSARAIITHAVEALEKGRESVLKEYSGGNFYRLTAEDVYKAACDGDNLARDLLKDAGRYLGVGIANIINILGPEAVILSGGLVGAWDIYVKEAIREASRRAFRDLFNKVEIIPSELPDDAGIIGSAGLVLRRL
jgi:glucokinase